MKWKGINQIGSYLTQSGLPPGQSQDIVIRLRQMIAEAANSSSSGSSSASDERVIGPESANNDAFYNKFKSPEEKPRVGEAGKDGIGWGYGGEDGQDGQDGMDGLPPDLSWLEDYIKSLINGGPGLPNEPECNAFRRKVENCGCDSFSKMVRACGLDKKENPSCPEGDVCAWLRRIERGLSDIGKRIRAIEKELENTVDC